MLTICRKCGNTFLRIKQRGRPRLDCEGCKPSKKVEIKTNNLGRNPYANMDDRAFNKKAKRDHQELQYSVDLKLAGIDKIPAERCITILGDVQNGKGDQIQLLMKLNTITSPAQIISFCDELTLEKKEEARKKNMKNRNRYPDGTFIDGNIVNYITLMNNLCDVVDFDACSALMPTSRATKELPKLFGKLTVPVLQVNVLVEGWGTDGYRSLNDDLLILETMSGFQDWKIVCEPREYRSIADDGSGKKWIYRTYTFVRK